MDILKAEIARKRKLLEEKNILDNNKKYFKRGELLAKEQEEYFKKYGPQNYDTVKSSDSEEKPNIANKADSTESGQSESAALPRAEVVKRLRERGHPILLFAENELQAFRRLRRIEIQEPEANRGFRNDFQEAMEKVDQAYLNEILELGTQTESEKQLKEDALDDSVTYEFIQEMAKTMGQGDRNHDMQVIMTLLQLPNDMENYMKYKIMGSVKQIRMKPACVPSKFACQPDSAKRSATCSIRSVESKKQRTSLNEEVHDNILLPSTSGTTSHKKTKNVSDYENIPGSRHHTVDKCIQIGPEIQVKEIQVHPETQNISVQVYPEREEKKIQVNLKPKHRSKNTQTSIHSLNKMTSPNKYNLVTVATSPHKFKGFSSVQRKLFAIPEENETLTSPQSSPQSLHSLQARKHISPSFMSLHSSITSESGSSKIDIENELSEIREQRRKEELSRLSLENTLSKIKNKPRFYIGIQPECFYLLKIIEENTKIPEELIMLCLKKIRMDTTFAELGDEFGISSSYASKIFNKNIPIIARSLKPFIIKSNQTFIRQNLPIAFRHKYSKTTSIIDCLEIEIQKPTDAVQQSLTWSNYKKANTIKYLISSTPDGIVNYISGGYGGRVSDVQLVEDCKYVDFLEPGSTVLADRGFKHLEPLLLQSGCCLVRPPSVASNQKLSKQEARQTKQIASLRIHIERVIRRLREFSMLRPHSVVNTNLLKYLNECIIIACALINMQDSLIRNV